MKNLPIILLLGALFYLIYEGKEGMGKFTNKNVTPPFESSFEDGIPTDYSPRDVHQFATVEKLESDLHFRRMKMKEQMKYDVEEFKKLKDEDGADQEEYLALLKKQEMLYENLKTTHKEMREQYLLRKEEDAARNTDLR